MEKLYQQIKEYIPYNPQEAADKRLMLQFMELNPRLKLHNEKLCYLNKLSRSCKVKDLKRKIFQRRHI